jgi:hypothetical protein
MNLMRSGDRDESGVLRLAKSRAASVSRRRPLLRFISAGLRAFAAPLLLKEETSQ